MILPVDPILSLVVTVAVFVYFALKGIGSAKKHDEKSIYDIFREIGEQSTEYKRYQERLKDDK